MNLYPAQAITPDINTVTVLSEAKYHESYARYMDDEKRYETFPESVARVMQMHKLYYKDRMSKELVVLLDEVEEAYANKLFLG